MCFCAGNKKARNQLWERITFFPVELDGVKFDMNTGKWLVAPKNDLSAQLQQARDVNNELKQRLLDVQYKQVLLQKYIVEKEEQLGEIKQFVREQVPPDFLPSQTLKDSPKKRLTPPPELPPGLQEMIEKQDNDPHKPDRSIHSTEGLDKKIADSDFKPGHKPISQHSGKKPPHLLAGSDTHNMDIGLGSSSFESDKHRQKIPPRKSPSPIPSKSSDKTPPRKSPSPIPSKKSDRKSHSKRSSSSSSSRSKRSKIPSPVPSKRSPTPSPVPSNNAEQKSKRSSSSSSSSSASSKCVDNRPVLGYWKIAAEGDPCRTLLHHLGIDFKDKRYIEEDKSHKGWEKAKEKLGVSSPNLPYWKDGDMFHSETMSVLRSIAAKYKPDYLGRNADEQGNVDAQITSIYDKFMAWFTPYMFENNWKQKKDQGIDAAFSLLETYSACIGDKNFVCGSEPSIADFILHWIIKVFRLYNVGMTLRFPKITSYWANMENLPGIDDAYKAQAGLPPFAVFCGWQKDNMKS